MDNNTAYAYLSELEDDLNEKISELDSAVSYVDEKVREKAILIKDRAISVLNNVKEKSADLDKVITDEDELYTAVETIRSKADSLFNDAIQKISGLQADVADAVGDETKDDIEELIDDGKETYQDFGSIETIETKKKVEVARSEVTEKALEVLKDWLKPGEVQK